MFKKIMMIALMMTLISSLSIVLYSRTASTEATTPVSTAVVNSNTPAPIVNAQENVGDPWASQGQVVSLDDFGFTLQQPSGEQVYVELGPPTYWQAQGITLAVGEMLTVNGFNLEGQYHAQAITKTDGSQLTTRTELGQPLWSGGASGNGQGSGTGEPQVQVDEWIILNGTITVLGRNSITIQTTDQQVITFQTGKQSFAAEQGITFAVGDAITVTGFWQNTQFSAGQITQVATNQTLMLRDPNGRPLWGGPGRTGTGNGQ